MLGDTFIMPPLGRQGQAVSSLHGFDEIGKHNQRTKATGTEGKNRGF
jgi:hypothetical protein